MYAIAHQCGLRRGELLKIRLDDVPKPGEPGLKIRRRPHDRADERRHPKLLNCVKDCEDYVLDTANKKHINNLVQLQIRTQLTLDQGLQQQAKGEQDLSENWIAEAQATLNGVLRILEAASSESETALRPFKGKGSHFEVVEQNCA